MRLDRLTDMRDLLSHRGPDGEGVRIDAGVGLGHRRLSIIDLEGGSQPLGNEDGSVWITFNGEIYNFRELRERLRVRGHVFATRSDTEVLVHAYEEYGLGFPKHLDGIFALALHDKRSGRVVLVRDHLGVKPLFYAVSDGTLVFGSEIKAVLAGLDRAPAVRDESLAEYLIFRYVVAPNTFFDAVRRLPPGHLAVWQDGRLSVQAYWTVPSADVSARNTLSDVVDDLDRMLRNAVESQLISDVPLGAFCSGGVDSGLVTGYASAAAAPPFRTFSVGFRDPAFDETPLARDTARRFATDHHVLIAEPASFLAWLPRLTWFHDEPLSHPNSVPLFLLSEFARRLVTVVLTGEGADELFGGYPRYHIARMRLMLRWTSPWLLRLLGAGIRHGPGHRADKLGMLLPMSPRDSLLYNSAYVDPATVSRLLGGPVAGCVTSRQALLHDADGDDAVAAMSRYELQTYLGCALDRMDRMSMATSLEARVPFLNVALVEWGIRLASGLKIAGRRNKIVLKALAERFLSPDITGGAKSGFGVPLRDWFLSSAFESLRQKLRDRDHPAAGHFDHHQIQRVLAEHASGAVDHGELLWLLANVYTWYDVQVTGDRQPPAPAPNGTLP